jgi:hypothetical protein
MELVYAKRVSAEIVASVCVLPTNIQPMELVSAMKVSSELNRIAFVHRMNISLEIVVNAMLDL